MSKLTGKCLCGNVTFRAEGDVLRVSACYCGMCRAQNGGGAFHGAELRGELTIVRGTRLKWFRASEKAKRGFCADCGSSLFWIADSDPSYFDVSLGALDDVSKFKLDAHIFVDSAQNYQTLPNDAPHMTEADVLASPLQEV